jgi:hypothetical protein
MEDERVDRLLRALPREMASPGFTARVLARLDEVEGTKASRAGRAGTWARIFELPRLTLPAAVLAATLAVAASLYLEGGGVLAPVPAARQSLAPAVAQIRPVAPAPLPIVPASTRRPEREISSRRAAALLEEIHAQSSRLQAEVRRVRESRGATAYLGGDEDMDLVVHLDRVREQPDRPLDPPPYPFD